MWTALYLMMATAAWLVWRRGGWAGQRRALTLYLNAREIVTMMTIGDHPEELAIGYLLNQNMLKPDDEITAIDYEEDIRTVVVRTKRQTDFEDKLKKKVQTSNYKH